MPAAFVGDVTRVVITAARLAERRVRLGIRGVALLAEAALGRILGRRHRLLHVVAVEGISDLHGPPPQSRKQFCVPASTRRPTASRLPPTAPPPAAIDPTTSTGS